jgi:Na+-translocating ferredoxin:NAD+ oxidoreductase RnfC subunit
MSYWQAGRTAPNYSRAVEAAHEAVRSAEAESLRTLQREYPMGSSVQVIHYRGQFEGEVVGHDNVGARVLVRNAVTGKVSKWWAAHVEPTDQSGLQKGGV